ncbi:MAG TPA: VOC family protein [Polyangiaceae bacterium]|nr:VOC family protein [Polyangiaceae bacterium]
MIPTPKLYPLIITQRLAETRRFYRDLAGFSVVIDRDEYLQLRSEADEQAPELCFMTPAAMAATPLPPFAGQGLIVSIPTASADRKAASLREAGARDVGEVSDKPWGWRSFVVPDPNGVLLDFFHPLAETAG